MLSSAHSWGCRRGHCARPAAVGCRDAQGTSRVLVVQPVPPRKGHHASHRGFRCVPAVRDLQASTRFYIGASSDFAETSATVRMAGSFSVARCVRLCLANVLAKSQQAIWGTTLYVAYLIVEGVDQFHAEVAERGAEVLSQPLPYLGRRSSEHRTPDGHRIRFGELMVLPADQRWSRRRHRTLCVALGRCARRGSIAMR